MPSEDKNQRRTEDLERRLRSRPGDRELLAQLVDLYFQSNRFDAAASLLEARVLGGEADWEILARCCEAHRRAGNPERACELLDAHGEGNNDRAAFWSLRGRLGEDLGDFDQAREDHAQAISIDQGEPEYRYRLGVTLMKARRDDEAIVAFDACVRANPRMTKAQINIGYIYDRSGDRQKAILAFQKAIEMDPTSVESHCNLGAALAESGRKREAVEEFRRAIELDSNYSMAHFNLGLIYLDERPAEAEAALRHAQAIDPQNWEIQYSLGVLYFKKGTYETAIRYLQHCREQQPDSSKVLRYLGMAFNKSDMPDHAIEALTRLCELEPDNGEAHFNLGIALDKKGLYEQAKTRYREADRLMERE